MKKKIGILSILALSALTVGALTRYIKYRLDNDPNLQEVCLKGEISNFKKHTRGHFYFTIKIHFGKS